ncbi:hypothetical protein [Polaribacter sp. R77954]|uniref:hypothetical protein n=1 Tax=Polaribacter sp. R77954 TaxID=3093870 RepID=UPI0037CA090F
MKNIVKYPRLIFVMLFLVMYYVSYISGIENGMLRTVFSITLAFVLSPRKKKVKTQAGEKTQITWVFLKKPIILD